MNRLSLSGRYVLPITESIGYPASRDSKKWGDYEERQIVTPLHSVLESVAVYHWTVISGLGECCGLAGVSRAAEPMFAVSTFV